MHIYIPRNKHRGETRYNFTCLLDDEALLNCKSYLCLFTDLRHLQYEDYTLNRKKISMRMKMRGGLLVNNKLYNNMYKALIDLRGPYLLDNYKEKDRENLKLIIQCRLNQDIDYYRILTSFYETSVSGCYFIYLKYNTVDVPLRDAGIIFVYIYIYGISIL